MIPLYLKLKNFLSYRDACLDFRGLHTACICGPNGAGKSSLLEAITWVLWGQSRGVTEDDVIHTGEREVRVEFIFQNQQQIYRVIRVRQRKQTTVLEFQIAQGVTQGAEPNLAPVERGQTQPLGLMIAPETPLDHLNFRPLTPKGLRATQQKIVESLKLDYETFVNSAYLRQGQADEFMLKRPSERKQVLADLLKLTQYDQLADRAKERSRDFKAQAQVLHQSLGHLDQQLQQRSAIDQECQERQATLVALQQGQDQAEAQLQQYQHQQQQHQTGLQTLELHQQQQQRLEQDLQRLAQELNALQHQTQDLQEVLAQAEAIGQGYGQWQQWQQQEEEWNQRGQQYQRIQAQHHQSQEQWQQHQSQLQLKIEKLQAQLEQVDRQHQDLQPTIAKKADVEGALGQLHQARDQLAQFEQLQSQAAPLVQRRSQLQLELHQIQTRLSTRLEELHHQLQQLHRHQAQCPNLLDTFESINEQVAYLEQRKRYLVQVREKGQERRNFLERLHAHQRDYETQLMELEQKAQVLNEPGVPCPFCARPLEGSHWDLAQQQHQEDRQEALDMLWVVKDQLVVSDREIQVLREEYRHVEQELSSYGTVLERRGQVQQQLSASLEAQEQWKQVYCEVQQLQERLQHCQFAPELQGELAQIEQTLEELAYDDRTHALARGEAERWRWAEIKQAEIRSAERQQRQLEEQRPQLEAELLRLQEQLADLQTGVLHQEMTHLAQQLAAIDYDPDLHQHLRHQLKQAQVWQWRYQELVQAQQTYPQLQERQATLVQQQEHQQEEHQQISLQIQQLQHQLTQTPDLSNPIKQLTQKLQVGRQQLDRQWSELGRLQQQQQQLDTLQVQAEQQQQQQEHCRYQQQLHQHLAQAFGKNGIQALLIENLLPQLESETNHILSRLSANQLHVQFITQRARRHGNSDKLIDTLDIRIADAKGTRPYETYSGGEAFRVNFAIRLALARLLARRSGTALQLLIVDEGFGTQDREGCDRLIAAINAISSDFACILTITHMPQFKEAFQTRIEVTKTPEGSKLGLHL
jgi:exonuclease SbcC